jgi:hypothetical protein
LIVNQAFSFSLNLEKAKTFTILGGLLFLSAKRLTTAELALIISIASKLVANVFR